MNPVSISVRKVIPVTWGKDAKLKHEEIDWRKAIIKEVEERGLKDKYSSLPSNTKFEVTIKFYLRKNKMRLSFSGLA